MSPTDHCSPTNTIREVCEMICDLQPLVKIFEGKSVFGRETRSYSKVKPLLTFRSAVKPFLLDGTGSKKCDIASESIIIVALSLKVET